MKKDKKAKSFMVGDSKHCKKQLFSNDSFIAFYDKTLAHYTCVVEDYSAAKQKKELF